MELELLLAREPWPQALDLLQAWGGLALLDPAFKLIMDAASLGAGSAPRFAFVDGSSGWCC